MQTRRDPREIGEVKELLEVGQRSGALESTEVLDTLHEAGLSTTEMGQTYALLRESGISIVESGGTIEQGFGEDPRLVEEMIGGDPRSRYTGDTVQMYLDAIGRTPLLNRAQEIQLARRVEAGTGRPGRV